MAGLARSGGAAGAVASVPALDVVFIGIRRGRVLKQNALPPFGGQGAFEIEKSSDARCSSGNNPKNTNAAKRLRLVGSSGDDTSHVIHARRSP